MRILIAFSIGLLVALMFPPGVIFAQLSVEEANNHRFTTLSEVLVIGEPPGPALWKIVRPDNGHVLWIVGEPPLLPMGTVWRTQAIERAIAQSQAIVIDGGFGIVPDGKVGIFRALSLVPSILGARKNPDGERLQELLPADVYARWLIQKSRYFGNDKGIEKWRPMFAAESLRSKALAKYQSSSQTPLWSMLHKAAKEQGIKIATPSVKIKIAPNEMRSSIKQFSKHTLNDSECFERNVAFVEALNDVDNIHARAVAWASGDLDGLRRTKAMPRFTDACESALLSSQAVAAFEMGDIPARVHSAWIDAVDQSLEENASTLAVLPIDELLSSDGRLATLRAKGYAIEEPSGR